MDAKQGKLTQKIELPQKFLKRRSWKEYIVERNINEKLMEQYEKPSMVRAQRMKNLETNSKYEKVCYFEVLIFTLKLVIWI